MCARSMSGAEERDGEATQRRERLQKVMAHAGVASRRKSEDLIAAGRVRVNGEIVSEQGTRVGPDDEIRVDGKLIEGPEKRVYYLLYKPVGYLSSLADPHHERLAGDLVPAQRRLYPVGRLDKDSEGLLLFTNDGQLTHRLTHPRYEQEKEYLALIRGQLSQERAKALRSGVMLEGERRPVRGVFRVLPKNWRWRGQAVPSGCRWVHVVLREGRKRQIRRMLRSVGCRVVRLVRGREASLSIEGLEPGEGRWLEEQEVRALRQAVGLD